MKGMDFLGMDFHSGFDFNGGIFREIFQGWSDDIMKGITFNDGWKGWIERDEFSQWMKGMDFHNGIFRDEFSQWIWFQRWILRDG